MPRPLVFAVCQSSSVDKDSNSASLFGLISGFTLSAVDYSRLLLDNPDPAAIVGAPVAWSAVVVWQKTDEDSKYTFDQKIAVFSPEGEQLEFAVTVPLILGGAGPTHTTRINGQGFPVSPPGEYTIRVSIRRQLTSDDWREVASFPMLISHEQIL